jgi:FkbM family methyltransferase
MHEGGLAFDLIRRVVRAVPDRLRGKTRLARLALRPFLKYAMPPIPDRFGNVLRLPSLEESISLNLFAYGVYEPDTLRAVLRYLPPSGIFVDVGANVGALALPVAACRPDAQVICIEADPEIVCLLRRNATENGRTNIRIVQCFAGSTDAAPVSFYRAPKAKFGMGSSGPQFCADSITLIQRSIDAVLDELAIDEIDVVKLDIEGAELGALQGLSQRLTSPRAPALVFEFADWAENRINGQAAGGAQQFLLSLDYDLFPLGSRGKLGARLERPVVTGFAMILALPTLTRRFPASRSIQQ